ncbi:MAG: hypothetical protein V4736_11315, partial [Bdellovibrionota bacterium]
MEKQNLGSKSSQDDFGNLATADLKEGFSAHLYETLWMAYSPFKVRLILSIVLGFTGRFLLLSNANLVGYWVDRASRPQHWINNFSTGDFLTTLFVTAFIGFGMTMAFRVMFSRLSAMAVSRLYDEVTARTSR